MARSKRKPGSKRAREKKRAERDAKRPSGYASTLIAEYRERCPTPAKADGAGTMEWLAAALVYSIDTMMTDPGTTPEAKRQHLASLAPQLVKALEPARLTRRIRALEDELEGLRQHGGQISRGTIRRPREGTSIS